MTEHIASDWDPFDGQMPSERQTVSEPGTRITVPPWVSSIGILTALLGFLVLFVGPNGDATMLVGSGLVLASFAAVFVAQALRKDKQWERWTYFCVARDNDWSFRLVKQPSAEDREEGNGDAAYDPAVERAYREIGQLMASRPGQPIPVQIAALYRGRTKSGVPFWMGAQLSKTVMVLAAEELKTDSRGNTGGHGHGIAMVLGFPLARNTGVKADLLAEALWDSRNDFDTESSQFNDIFKIKLRNDSSDEANLLRVLSPATQTSMIDLALRYKAQFLIDGDRIFMAGYDLLNLDDPQAVADVLAEMVDDFASAATSFKHYAE
ncbi:hypothetical protein ACFQ14_00080 [Pseudahrensia aquimaris]|uniref:DUF3137 domain-containing protein n=1 Tax=Pseudahrensia aquimaris TaxID=744461 RepID=A0ABW3FB44_9HYPH